MPDQPTDHVDVLIIGAGISGIGMACHLTRDCPDKSYLILERRQAIGGTWDLFRYPGVRSDSDMFTFGYNFRPWNEPRILADGASIRQYLQDTADEYGVPEHIRFGRHATAASWSTDEGRWTVTHIDDATGDEQVITADFVVTCTGYYDYDKGYRPTFPGEEKFRGTFVHPQAWPQDLDYAGKKVVIIGSGATAITLVPAMAPTAGSVTMLQRSPSYVVSQPGLDQISIRLRKVLPEAVVARLARARRIAIQRGSYAFFRAQPAIAKKILRTGAERHLRGKVDMANFTPRYDPWDQRLCVIPDADLFRTLREGKAEIITDTVDTFTETGIRLSSGRELEADIVVTATGLTVQSLGGAKVTVDGEPLVINRTVTYKGVLIEGVPNAAMIFGYTNSSWTLKADIASEYVDRLLKYMDAHGYTQVVAHATDADRGTDSALGSLKSGYVQRGNDVLPRQGTNGVWKVRNDYLRDAPMLTRAPVADDALTFSDRARTPAPEPSLR